MKRSIFLFSFLMFCVIFAMSQQPQRVPAVPYPITIAQSDGTELTIRLVGDENSHFVATPDGYVIVEGVNGDYYFGKVDCKGRTVPSKHIARNEGERSKKTEKSLRKISRDKRLKRTILDY